MASGLAWALAALPPEALPPLACGLARLDRFRTAARWKRAHEALRLAFALPPGPTPPALEESLIRGWLERLRALRASTRPATLPQAEPPRLCPTTLWLTARVGSPWRSARLARRLGLRLCGVEGVPQVARHAAATAWLGQPALRSTRRLARALAAGRPVRLLLWLAGHGWYATPRLDGGPPGAVLQRALDVLAVLARARPDLVDWSRPRGQLRAGLERRGLPSWSRRAPWAGPHGARQGRQPGRAP